MLSEGRKHTVVRAGGPRARHPYLMVFLLVVVLETILTLPPVLELIPRLLPELKVLPPPNPPLPPPKPPTLLML